LPAACWQVVLVPLHLSVVQGLPSSAHLAPALPAACWQVVLVPLHLSVVQGLPSSAHELVLGSGEQVPRLPARLHAPQPPLHALLQQTPFAQKPVLHWLFVAHVAPTLSAAVTVVAASASGPRQPASDASDKKRAIETKTRDKAARVIATISW
jgi:hypothetical protein